MLCVYPEIDDGRVCSRFPVLQCNYKLAIVEDVEWLSFLKMPKGCPPTLYKMKDRFCCTRDHENAFLGHPVTLSPSELVLQLEILPIESNGVDRIA